MSILRPVSDPPLTHSGRALLRRTDDGHCAEMAEVLPLAYFAVLARYFFTRRDDVPMMLFPAHQAQPLKFLSYHNETAAERIRSQRHPAAWHDASRLGSARAAHSSVPSGTQDTPSLSPGLDSAPVRANMVTPSRRGVAMQTTITTFDTTAEGVQLVPLRSGVGRRPPTGSRCW